MQSDEWRQTTDLLHAIFEDRQKPPLTRLRILVHTFIRSECEEASVRGALDDAAPLYRDAPEAIEIRQAWDHQARTFMAETLPDVSEKARNRAADLVMTTLAAVGKQFPERSRSIADIDAYADAVADMPCAYIRHMMAR